MNSILLEFAMFPTDKGDSVSPYVSRIIKMIDESGFSYQLTPMGTIIETETIDDALALVKKAYEVLEKDCERVYASLKFDIRKAPMGRLQKKVQSIEEKIGQVNKSC
ncbi:MTH1187 family thiamine-binding protein [Prolixibacteraceae bacterium JC049]|nr:MTH1187 family thiamine-binding protein [Prolixibacteraceae bacterium JC049]